MPEPNVRMNVYPGLGCFMLLIVLIFLFLLPFVFVEMMTRAVRRLHVSETVAVLSVLGIFLGSFFNIPVYRMERSEPQPLQTWAVWGVFGQPRMVQQVRSVTVIAVNFGGCIVPLLLALWQIRYLLQDRGQPLTALIVVTLVNITVCYYVARPVQGVGIMMPGFISPAVSILLTWMMMSTAGLAEIRAPVAFVAGVMGPLIGADLLHLKDISRMHTGMLSIGGAGTFDGIVISGILAALLA